MSNKLSRMILMVLIIVAIGFVGFKYINKPAESMSEVKAIEEEQVMRGDITIGFDGDGEAEIPSVNLDFDIGGKLVELYVSEGDEIKVGQLLGKLDDTDHIKLLKTAEVNYKKAVATLEQKIETREISLISQKQKLEELKAKLDTGIDKVKSGMTCAVEFIIKQQKDVVYISNKAVSMIDGSQVVKVKAENGDIEIRNIKTGLTDGKYVEVTEGLNVGETIIIEDNKVE